jgi:hypothetical protein
MRLNNCGGPDHRAAAQLRDDVSKQAWESASKLVNV